jgi:hypothetical protein
MGSEPIETAQERGLLLGSRQRVLIDAQQPV